MAEVQKVARALSRKYLPSINPNDGKLTPLGIRNDGIDPN
jgi:hypothetical protein